VSTFFDKFLTLFGKSILERGGGGGMGGGDLKYIIQGFSGVVRPGEMLLVLGRPGSGTSTFLRALTNQKRDFIRVLRGIYTTLGCRSSWRRGGIWGRFCLIVMVFLHPFSLFIFPALFCF